MASYLATTRRATFHAEIPAAEPDSRVGCRRWGNGRHVTNTLPIRRLTLADGEEAQVAAVWIGLPELEIERLEQVYRRVGNVKAGLWRYEYRPAGSDDRIWITVDDDCIVVD